jgi:hypothetical protein
MPPGGLCGFPEFAVDTLSEVHCQLSFIKVAPMIKPVPKVMRANPREPMIFLID